MMVLSMVYLNAILQLNAKNIKEGVLIATSMTSITAILTLMAVFTMAIPRPDGFFSIGVSWAFYWIYRELKAGAPHFRKNIGTDMVSDETLEAFRMAAEAVSFMADCMALLAFLLRGASCL